MEWSMRNTLVQTASPYTDGRRARTISGYYP